MRKNIGSVDKLIRVIFAFLIAVLNYLKIIDGLRATFLLAIAVYIAISALLNFSIFYHIFGWKTTKK